MDDLDEFLRPFDQLIRPSTAGQSPDRRKTSKNSQQPSDEESVVSTPRCSPKKLKSNGLNESAESIIGTDLSASDRAVYARFAVTDPSLVRSCRGLGSARSRSSPVPDAGAALEVSADVVAGLRDHPNEQLAIVAVDSDHFAADAYTIDLVSFSTSFKSCLDQFDSAGELVSELRRKRTKRLAVSWCPCFPTRIIFRQPNGRLIKGPCIESVKSVRCDGSDRFEPLDGVVDGQLATTSLRDMQFPFNERIQMGGRSLSKRSKRR